MTKEAMTRMFTYDRDACISEMIVESSAPQGGDAGHGSFAKIHIEDVILNFSGDAEIRGVAALFDAISKHLVRSGYKPVGEVIEGAPPM